MAPDRLPIMCQTRIGSGIPKASNSSPCLGRSRTWTGKTLSLPRYLSAHHIDAYLSRHFHLAYLQSIGLTGSIYSIIPQPNALFLLLLPYLALRCHCLDLLFPRSALSQPCDVPLLSPLLQPWDDVVCKKHGVTRSDPHSSKRGEEPSHPLSV